MIESFGPSNNKLHCVLQPQRMADATSGGRRTNRGAKELAKDAEWAAERLAALALDTAQAREEYERLVEAGYSKKGKTMRALQESLAACEEAAHDKVVTANTVQARAHEREEQAEAARETAEQEVRERAELQAKAKRAEERLEREARTVVEATEEVAEAELSLAEAEAEVEAAEAIAKVQAKAEAEAEASAQEVFEAEAADAFETAEEGGKQAQAHGKYSSHTVNATIRKKMAGIQEAKRAAMAAETASINEKVRARCAEQKAQAEAQRAVALEQVAQINANIRAKLRSEVAQIDAKLRERVSVRGLLLRMDDEQRDEHRTDKD